MRVPYYVLMAGRLMLCGLLLFSLPATASNLHDIVIEKSSEATYQLKSVKANSTWQLTLTTPNGKRLFALTDNMRILSPNVDQNPFHELQLYKGELVDNANSWARFANDNGRLTGAFYDGTSLYFVNQRNRVDADVFQVQRLASGAAQLLIYNADDVKHSGTCALESEHAAEAFTYSEYIEDLVQMMDAVPSKELLVSLVADVEFEASSNQGAATEMAVEMNIVDGIFSEQVGVKLTINNVRVLDDNGPLTLTDPEDLIVAYRTYVNLNFTNPGVSHLFTGKDLDGGTIGIAYVGAICNSFSVGITQRFGNNTALVTAHELGHNLGAPHDNQANSACSSTPGDFLMNPRINGSDTFSDCSLTQMRFLAENGACLVDLTPPEITSNPNLMGVVGEQYLYDPDSTVEATGSGEITFNLDIGPDGMTLSPEGLVSWTPAADQVDSHPVQITATSIYGSDTQLFDVVVEQPVQAEFLDFSTVRVQPYGGRQDAEGSFVRTQNNLGLRIVGNRWKKVDFEYTITPDTVIEFDFISTEEGEVQGIGFDTDTSFDRDRTFKIFGTHPWGIEDFRYTTVGQVQHFRIPVGQYYQGDIANLFFVMDNDVPSPTSNVEFSHIQVYESGNMEPPPPPPSSLDFNTLNITTYATNQIINGFHEVLDSGSTIKLDGNVWRKVPNPISINSGTVIEFDYKSTLAGEIHGFGFTTNNDLSRPTTFSLMGSQGWGITDFVYTGDGEYQHFEIPVGQFYTGDFEFLIFAMDNDVSSPQSNAFFRNIVIRP